MYYLFKGALKGDLKKPDAKKLADACLDGSGIHPTLQADIYKKALNAAKKEHDEAKMAREEGVRKARETRAAKKAKAKASDAAVATFNPNPNGKI